MIYKNCRFECDVNRLSVGSSLDGAVSSEGSFLEAFLEHLLELRERDHAVFGEVVLLDDGFDFASGHFHAKLLHRIVYVVFRYLARAVSVELVEDGE